MKFCFYLTGINESGVSVVTSRIANYIGENHDVEIIVDGPVSVSKTYMNKFSNVKFILPDYRVEEVNSPNIKNKKILSFLKGVMKPIFGRFCWEVKRSLSNQYRHYDFSDYDKAFICCLSGKFRLAFNKSKNITYIIHNHKSIQLSSGYLIGDFFDKLFFKHSLSSKGIISVSESVKRDLISKFNVAENKIKVVYNPLVLSQNTTRALTVDKTKSFLVVGRLSIQKRVDRAIDAFAIFVKKYNHISCHLNIAGKGDLEDKLKKQVKDLGLENKVKFLGQRDDVDYLINSSCFVLISSDFEGFSTVAIESILSGTLVVASPSDSLLEISELSPGSVLVARDFSSSALCVSMFDAVHSKNISTCSIEHLGKIVSPEVCVAKYIERA